MQHLPISRNGIDALLNRFRDRPSNDCMATQISDLKTDPRTVFRLLDLPRELRDQIYDKVFECHRITFHLATMDIDAVYGDAAHQLGEKFPALLLTNCQVFVEAMEQFYRRVEICFSPWPFTWPRKLDFSLLIDPAKARYSSIYGEMVKPSGERKAVKFPAKFSDETTTVICKLMDWLKLQKSIAWEELKIEVFGRSEIRKVKLDLRILEPLSTKTNLKKIHFVTEDQLGRDFAFIGPYLWNKEFSRVGQLIVGGNGAVRKWSSLDNEKGLLYDHLEVKKA